jgi:hypothetical protein
MLTSLFSALRIAENSFTSTDWRLLGRHIAGGMPILFEDIFGSISSRGVLS